MLCQCLLMFFIVLPVFYLILASFWCITQVVHIRGMAIGCWVWLSRSPFPASGEGCVHPLPPPDVGSGFPSSGKKFSGVLVWPWGFVSTSRHCWPRVEKKWHSHCPICRMRILYIYMLWFTWLWVVSENGCHINTAQTCVQPATMDLHGGYDNVVNPFKSRSIGRFQYGSDFSQ